MAYDCLRAGQLEADPRSDPRARPALLAVAAVGHDATRRWRRSTRRSTTPATARGHRPRRRASWSAAIASTASCCPATRPTEEAIADFPQLANLQRLYHGVPNGFSETPKDGFQPRLGMAYAINELTTFRAGVGRFLNRVQINTTAAYGFNPPLSEMQTVINGIVDAPGGAVTRNFPLVMAMQSPDFTNPTSWAWNATVDRELPWQMRGTLSYVGPLGVEPRARAQRQPAAAGHDSGESRASTPTRCGRIWASAASRCTRRPASRATTACRRRSSGARHARRRLQRRLHVLANEGRRQRPRRHPAERLRRQRLLRHLGSRSAARAGVAGAVPVPDARVGGGAAALGARQLGRLRHLPGAVGRAVHGAHGRRRRRRRPGQRPAVLRPGRRSERRCGPIGIRRSSRATWFDRTAFRIPTAGTFATSQEKNSLRQPGFWDINLSLRKGFHVAARSGSISVSRRSTSSTARVSDNAVTNPTLPDFGSITSRVGNRTMQIGMQYLFLSASGNADLKTQTSIKARPPMSGGRTIPPLTDISHADCLASSQ